MRQRALRRGGHDIRKARACGTGFSPIGQSAVMTPAGSHKVFRHPSTESERSAEAELWDKTDRPLHFRDEDTAAESLPPGALPVTSDQPRARWLEENGVETEFLDAGIGCCWFAYRGDKEPVWGETEYEALMRLARENGLELWREPLADPAVSAAA